MLLFLCVLLGVHNRITSSPQKSWTSPRFIAPSGPHVTYDLIGASECRPGCPSRWALLSPVLLYFKLCGGAVWSVDFDVPAFSRANVARSRSALLVPWNEPTVAYRGYFHYHWSRPHTEEEYRGLFLPVAATDVLPYCVTEQVNE